MNKPFNKWIKTKMTRRQGDGFYVTNMCPDCAAESVVQTNACPSCGTILKGYAKDCGECRFHVRCAVTKCTDCENFKTDMCRCITSTGRTTCPFFEKYEPQEGEWNFTR